MNYHNIQHDDICNGEGLRVTLFVSGCSHFCANCQNTQTWDCNSGIPFDEKAKEELFNALSKDYIEGITLSGGDPLHSDNVEDVYKLITEIKSKFPQKTIWLYTGYKWEDIVELDHQNRLETFRTVIVGECDIIVDGKFVEELKDINYHWAGSTNQRVIDVQETLKQGNIIVIR